MAIWVDAYIVEDEEGTYYELFGDKQLAEEYVESWGDGVLLSIRKTIVDIEE